MAKHFYYGNLSDYTNTDDWYPYPDDVYKEDSEDSFTIPWRNCCSSRCYEIPLDLEVDPVCKKCHSTCFCKCLHERIFAIDFTKAVCNRCWNQFIEECGCDGKPSPTTSLCYRCWNLFTGECDCEGNFSPESNLLYSSKKTFCCSYQCFVPPTEKVEGIPCEICSHEGYCNCRCVQYRLEKYNPDSILSKNTVYEILRIDWKLVSPPLFLQIKLHTPQLSL